VSPLLLRTREVLCGKRENPNSRSLRERKLVGWAGPSSWVNGLSFVSKFKFCSNLNLFELNFCSKFEFCSKFKICFKFEICSKFEFCSKFKIYSNFLFKIYLYTSKFCLTEEKKSYLLGRIGWPIRTPLRGGSESLPQRAGHSSPREKAR
jgi:hypothetical protein